MYYDYFGLQQPPFKITPDTSLFFPGGNRGAILEALVYAITNGEGIVKVVGEVGSGKTMLCRMLEVELPKNVEIVYLANPSLSPDNILHAIAFELKLPVEANEERLEVMNSLQSYLVKKHSENCQVVVFVEEAQSMPLATLEEIRLLSNLETQKYKLLQIVLFGQPELDNMISRREIRQLKERITYSFNLNPLKQDEVKDYLNSRMRACGYRSSDVFTHSAVREITRFSKGLLRRINILADKSLLAAYAVNTHKVGIKQVRIAAQDSEFITNWQRTRILVPFLIGVAGLLIAWLVPLTSAKEKVIELTGINLKHTNEKIETVAPSEAGTADNKSRLSVNEIFETRFLPQDNTHYYDYLSPGDTDSLYHMTAEGGINIQPDETINTSEAVSSERAVLLQEVREGNFYTYLIEPADATLSNEESDRLIRQLQELPPEAGYAMKDDTACPLCTSMIYRPLINQENL